MTSLASATNSVETAGTGVRLGRRSRAGRQQQGLPAPRLCRESGGVTPTAQMTRVTGSRRAEVQGCAPVIEGGGRLLTDFNHGDEHEEYLARPQCRSNGRGPWWHASLKDNGRLARASGVEPGRLTSPDLFHSGGGLGIQEPGSIGQGRARERAMCPAVTRFTSAPHSTGSLPQWRDWPHRESGLPRRRSFLTRCSGNARASAPYSGFLVLNIMRQQIPENHDA